MKCVAAIFSKHCALQHLSVWLPIICSLRFNVVSLFASSGLPSECFTRLKIFLKDSKVIWLGVKMLSGGRYREMEGAVRYLEISKFFLSPLLLLALVIERGALTVKSFSLVGLDSFIAGQYGCPLKQQGKKEALNFHSRENTIQVPKQVGFAVALVSPRVLVRNSFIFFCIKMILCFILQMALGPFQIKNQCEGQIFDKMDANNNYRKPFLII